MNRFKVVMTSQLYPSVDIERRMLEEIGARLEVASGERSDIERLAHDADALLTHLVKIDHDLISRLTRCRVIARYGIGVDCIDLEAAAARGIVVTNVPDYCVEEVATHTLACLLCLQRNIVNADHVVRSGGWSLSRQPRLRRLSTLTIGIIGIGRIGRLVASKLAGLGCSIVAHDPYVNGSVDGLELLPLDDVLRAADALLLHVPLTNETKAMIAAPQLELMKRECLIVNTSRGGLVVEDDLFDALRSGRIAGAALDVFEVEPLDGRTIADVPNLLVTPHMAYSSVEATEESQYKAVAQVIAVLTGGQPDYPVKLG
jgi:D-3-phosphoglycerate dehydrogenase / 2-oxoglutarate reductase